MRSWEHRGKLWPVVWGWLWVFLVAVAAPQARATPTIQKIGPHLYAYISDNDGSSNSTFLVRADGVLVVDTGLDAQEGEKLLAAIRRISPAPVRYIVNTHYHPDHQGANGVVGPNAVVISTVFTREATLRLMTQMEKRGSQAGGQKFAFRPATLTFDKKITVHLDDEPVEIYATGPGHTMGDAVVYFPEEKSVATGDLFMNRSCPAMDKGSVKNWIHTLAWMLTLSAEHYVPGHFELGTRADVERFHAYLATLWEQVDAAYRAGVPIGEMGSHLRLSDYSDFRQFPRYQATFVDNAKHVYREIEAAKAGSGGRR
ncbi:MAG: MBL fold metallo-hydrolase [Acidobacteriota bacterium]|nr:MBL fold metallo-hydrolase [Acidobacteriota bacterium]